MVEEWCQTFAAVSSLSPSTVEFSAHRAHLSVMRALIFAALLIAASPSLADQKPNGSYRPLGEPQALVCSFSKNVFADLYPPLVELGNGGMKPFTLAAIDYAKGTAQLVGNLGATPLFVIQGEAGLSFLEITETGNATVTSVYGPPNSAGTFPAVHSRHVTIHGRPSIGQFYGRCEGKW